VPEDISLVGFDDQAEAAFATPPLTTMKQPAVEMGEAAAQALLKLINNEQYELACSPVELQIRESVARLR
jgi:LacI family transcriptional regulator